MKNLLQRNLKISGDNEKYSVPEKKKHYVRK